MALVVQSDDGDVAGANGYISVAEFKAYHDARGNEYSDNDTDIEQQIVRGTDYADTRFRFRGRKLTAAQTTQFPRSGITDPDGNDVTGIPTALKNAAAEYALRASAAPLMQDAPAPQGGNAIQSITQKVDVIEQSVTYVSGGQLGQAVMPSYPAADLWLARAGLIDVGRVLYR